MSSDRLENLMNQAEELMQADEHERAISIFQQALRIAPSSVEVLRQYGKALAQIKRDDESFKIFEQALKIAPKDVDVLRNYGTVLSQRYRHDKAFEIFKKALAIQPTDVKLLNSYCKALKQANRLNESFEVFDILLQIEPKNIKILNSYAQNLILLKEYEKAFEIFERSLQIEPNNPITLRSYANTLSRYAKALASNGQYDKAFPLFEQSLKNQSDNPITLSSYANALSRYANALASIGQYDKAFPLFERSLKNQPDNPITLSSYANSLASIGQYDKAFPLFEQSLKNQPDNPITLSSYANVLTSTGQYEEALKILERLLQIEPDNPKTLSRYANALSSTGQYEEALKFFEKSLQIEPHNHRTLGCYANALVSSGQHDNAFLFFEQSLQLEPADPITLSRYANALVSTGQHEEALPFFERALKIDSQNYKKLNSYIYFKYALVLEKLDKYQEAIDQLAAIKMQALTPYQANVIRVNLGRLYYRIKQPEKGNEYFEAAIANSDDRERTLLYSARSILASNPHNETAVEILRQVAEDSPRYAQALEMLTLNLSEEDYFEMLKTDTESGLSDTEMLNRAMYHKIANEISILKGIAYRILRHSEQEYPLLRGIIQDIEDVFAEVDRRRAAQKSEIETISHDDYSSILAVISKTAHDISDFVNNQLAVIESKTRRAMRKLQPSEAHYSQFEKLLTQLELTQTALSDLKAINEGITIKNHRFKVKKLFEKWETMPQIEQAQVLLDIHNGDSEFKGDEEKIKSALNELVENSLKHNSNQQNLTIRITSQDVINPPEIRGRTMPGEQKYLFIELADNGEGVPEDKKDWIFQPLRTTSQEGKGSGLGLFIIRKTLTKMNGYIRETGCNGARFEIYIPYTQGENR